MLANHSDSLDRTNAECCSRCRKRAGSCSKGVRQGAATSRRCRSRTRFSLKGLRCPVQNVAKTSVRKSNKKGYLRCIPKSTSALNRPLVHTMGTSRTRPAVRADCVIRTISFLSFNRLCARRGYRASKRLNFLQSRSRNSLIDGLLDHSATTSVRPTSASFRADSSFWIFRISVP